MSDYSEISNDIKELLNKNNIEFEEITINEVYDALTLLINDIETSSNFDADFGDVRFDDLD